MIDDLSLEQRFDAETNGELSMLTMEEKFKLLSTPDYNLSRYIITILEKYFIKKRTENRFFYYRIYKQNEQFYEQTLELHDVNNMIRRIRGNK